MSGLTSFATREIGGRDRLEDYAVDRTITTEAGLRLHIILVCDGTGGGDAGELAARHTANTILDVMETSEITNVPRLIVASVEEANRAVYSEFRGRGSSTVAMVVVHTNDPDAEHGRAYIASVGNSRIYLMRDTELVRLNIDHTLANEYIYAGQMSVNEAARLENADYPTRMIGLSDDVQVDIGFYVERGSPFVNSQRAFNIGKRGMLLREADTLFVVTEGIIRDDDNGRAEQIIRDEEFLRHALDDDVERATRNLIRYAAGRKPTDNLSLVMLFVPSRFRRAVRLGSGLNRSQRVAIGTGTIVALTLIVFLLYGNIQRTMEIRAFRDLQRTATQIVLVASQTATPTATFTATPTLTPTPTATIPPTAIANEVGLRYHADRPNEAIPMFPRQRLTREEVPSFIIMRGPNPDLLPAPVRAVGFLEPNSSFNISSIDNTPGNETLELTLDTDSELIVHSYDFANGGISVELFGFGNVRFFTSAEAFAVRQIPPDSTLDAEDTDKAEFACISAQIAECLYTLSADSVQTRDTGGFRLMNNAPQDNNVITSIIPVGQVVLLDLKNSALLELDPISYERATRYYDLLVEAANNTEETHYLEPYLDPDEDTVLYPADACEFEPGPAATNGCPDSDGDNIRDLDDVCPLVPGIARPDNPDRNGCPEPTATPLPDADGDGIIDIIDLCPNVIGVVENDGCPIQADPNTQYDPAYDGPYGGG